MKQKAKLYSSNSSFFLVFSTSIALLLIGAFAMMLIHANALSDYLKSNLKLTVYLDKDLSTEQRSAVSAAIIALPSTLKAAAGRDSAVHFTSKEEAAKRFIAETGEDFVAFLGTNPLRDAYEVMLDPEYVTVEGMKEASERIAKIPNVFEVTYIKNLVKALTRNLATVLLVLGSLALVLISLAAILIHNTIRLALHSERFLVRSMQLVGARPWFIQRPFVVKSALQGLFAGFIASAALGGIHLWFIRNVQAIQDVMPISTLIIISFALMMLGSILGALAAFASIRKFLHHTTDQYQI